jgi:hypothetical protein
MTVGLLLPHLSESDPGFSGEGSLDPLSLAPISDRLADELALHVRARMTRIRFVTAMAAAASTTRDLVELPPGDGVSTPWLVFEWHLVQALARERSLPETATFGVPGIMKARAAVARSRGLDARSYLQTPKVFGFHGVFRRLAKSFGVVDDVTMPGPGADRLLRAWEADQDLEGFTDGAPNTTGGRLARSIETLIREAYRAGKVVEPLNSHIWARLVRHLRPDEVGPLERKILNEWVTSSELPTQRELLGHIRRHKSWEALARGRVREDEVLRAIRPDVSPELAVRLDAIDAYEAVCELLECALYCLCYVSTAQTSPVEPSTVSDPVLEQASRELPDAIRLAEVRLSELSEPLLAQFATLSAPFAQKLSMGDFVQALIDRHQLVQERKPPRGKAPWFIAFPDGLRVRPPYFLYEKPEIRRHYVHPYRIYALATFLLDLR